MFKGTLRMTDGRHVIETQLCNVRLSFIITSIPLQTFITKPNVITTKNGHVHIAGKSLPRICYVKRVCVYRLVAEYAEC